MPSSARSMSGTLVIMAGVRDVVSASIKVEIWPSFGSKRESERLKVAFNPVMAGCGT